MFELNGASRSEPPPGFLRLGVWIEVGRHPVIMFLCVFDRRVSFGMLRCGYGRDTEDACGERPARPDCACVCCTCMNGGDKQAEKQTPRCAHTLSVLSSQDQLPPTVVVTGAKREPSREITPLRVSQTLP